VTYFIIDKKEIASMASQIQLEEGWLKVLEMEFTKPYFIDLKSKLIDAKNHNAIIYPQGHLIFNAFELAPWESVKVVIIGQDPYHQPGQAMGLSFSVPKNIQIPPSLRNIYKEINRDLGVAIPKHGDLTTWAKQGVLLLNSILTVEANKPASHKNFGWEIFTDAAIKNISDNKENIVFMLWGNHAQNKKSLIDSKKHLILESRHPSPLAGNSFVGNNHFSTCNKYLVSKNLKEIAWEIH